MNQIADPNDLFAAASLRPDLCVEFFGLPGSGKTTIAHEVHAILARSNPELVFAPRLLRDEAGIAVRAAAKLRLVVSEVARKGTSTDEIRRTMAVRQPRFHDSLRAAFAVATVRSLYAKLRRRTLGAVLDQGLLQALWSVQLRAPDDEDCSALAAGMLNDAVFSGRFHVAVQTPQAVCIERLEARSSKHSRMQKAGTATDYHLWQKAELLRQSILGDLHAAYRTQGIPDLIIAVDGTADPAVTARKIVQDLLLIGPSQGLRRASPGQGAVA